MGEIYVQQDIPVIELHCITIQISQRQRKVIHKLKLHVAFIKQSSISKEESLINVESYIHVVK